QLRFYKRSGATTITPRTMRLWSNAGTLITSQVLTGETSFGWQTVTLTIPVTVSTGTNYTVSYTNSGTTTIGTMSQDPVNTGQGINFQTCLFNNTVGSFPTTVSPYSYFIDL